jgi:hypothetical protein
LGQIATMKPRDLAVLCLLLASTHALLANGGGYFRGGVERAGDLAGFEPKATEHIRMLDEKLTVTLGPKHADVDVRYLLRNETSNKVAARFGFPVEELLDNPLDEGGEADPKKSTRGDGKLKYCRNYVITAGGKVVAATWQGEEKATGDKRLRGIAGWLVSQVTFAPNEEIPVHISFQSGYPSEEWSVSDDSFTGAAVFRYRLSTAACWAGTIGTGSITLRSRGTSTDPKVLKPVNRFRRAGSDWVWNFENLEPAMDDDFEVEVIPAVKSYMRRTDRGQADKQNFATYIERGSAWTMVHSNYRVKASSTLPPEGTHKYDAANVRDYWADVIWSEGAKGPGTGEWLELEPIEPKPLTAISIYPGCRKSDALFLANARPKKISVELNGEHRFTVDVPDSKDEFEFPVTGYTQPVSKVRLTFREVWPGKRYEDLCVSGVLLHVRLARKPAIQQAR